jgi:hypothetical protein
MEMVAVVFEVVEKGMWWCWGWRRYSLWGLRARPSWVLVLC